GNYLAGEKPGRVGIDHPAFDAVEAEVRGGVGKLLSIRGSRTVRDFHWDLGRVMWDDVGMARNKAGLETALAKVRALRTEFWQNVNVLGDGDELNQSLEAAGRVADCIELGELMCIDAWHREESCGGHFREEHQTEDGEAKRDDEHFAYVAAW